MDDLSRLRNCISDSVKKCNAAEGGIFAFRSSRLEDGCKVVAESAPNDSFYLRNSDRDQVKEQSKQAHRNGVRSASELAEKILRLIVQVGERSKNVGRVEVKGKRRKNGKVDYELTSIFLDEDTLRPDELE